MKKVTLTVAVALLSLYAKAQHETYVIPSFDKTLYKARHYYFYLDSTVYKVFYRGEILPVEYYKGKSRYVLEGFKEGELSIHKVKYKKKRRTIIAEESIYLNRNITFTDPKLLVYLNGTEPGNQFRVSRHSQSTFEVRSYVAGGNYDNSLELESAEIRYEHEGEKQLYTFKNSNTIPADIMRTFLESGAQMLNIQLKFKWKEGDIISSKSFDFYFDE